MAVDGAPVETLVASGYDVAQGLAYGTGVAQTSTGAWLRSKLGIPTVAHGNIVRDPVSGNSWLIDSQGYRRPITDAGMYACLTGNGHQVTESATLPFDLSDFGRVWWVDTSEPSIAQQDQLVVFEEAGGGVFLRESGGAARR